MDEATTFSGLDSILCQRTITLWPRETIETFNDDLLWAYNSEVLAWAKSLSPESDPDKIELAREAVRDVTDEINIRKALEKNHPSDLIPYGLAFAGIVWILVQLRSGLSLPQLIVATIAAVALAVMCLTWGILDQKRMKQHNRMIRQQFKDERLAREKKQIAEEKRIQEEAKQPERCLELERKEQEIAQKYQRMLDGITSVEVHTSERPSPLILKGDFPEIKYSPITAKTSTQNLGNFVAIDVETTGLQPARCEIIDLAAVRFCNFEPVEQFCTLLSPKKSLSDDAQQINHITHEMLAGKPHFQDVAGSLVEFIGKDNIVGHNLSFDLSFIIRYGANVAETKRKYYDTLDIARKTVKKQNMKWDREFECYFPDENQCGVDNYKLDTLCQWYGIRNPNSHRAQGDAIAAGLLFKKLVREKLNCVL